MDKIPQRWLNVGILLSFLVGYLEWGGGNSACVWQVEYQVLFGRPEVQNFAHPMIALPAVGQLLVLFTLFQKTPSRRITSIGIVLMGVFIVLLALIAILGGSVKTGLSTLPFLTLAAIHFVRAWRARAGPRSTSVKPNG
jgi:hypothetical protein